MAVFKLNGKTLDRVYILRGEIWGGYRNHHRKEELRFKYIQYNPYSGRPIIVTSLGYNAGRVIVFKSESEAENFRLNFLTSDLRQNNDLKRIWVVREYKPKYIADPNKMAVYNLVEKNDSEYGTYYMLKIEYEDLISENDYLKSVPWWQPVPDPFGHLYEDNDDDYKFKLPDDYISACMLLDQIESKYIINYIKDHYNVNDFVNIYWAYQKECN